MTLTQNRDDLLSLIADYCDGTIAAAAGLRLESLLRDDAGARSLYVEFLDLHLALRKHAKRLRAEAGSAEVVSGQWPVVGMEPPVPLPPPLSVAEGSHRPTVPPSARPTAPSPRRPITRSSLAWSILAASLVFAVYFIGISWDMLDRSRHAPRAVAQLQGDDGSNAGNEEADGMGTMPATSPVATILGSEAVQWSSSEMSNLKSQIGKGERLQIDSGLVELELKQGVKLLIEGPAEWTIDGNNNATLKRGKLVAKVPKQAIGFTLETPTSKIIDLGTEFGVEVNQAGDTAARVFQGEIDVDSGKSAQQWVDRQPVSGRQRLVAGQTTEIARQNTRTASGDWLSAEGFVRVLPTAAIKRAPPEECHIAYQVPAGTIGNQAGFNGPLGMDFVVVSPIEIQRLGVFDSGSDGIAAPGMLIVEIWSRDDRGTPDDFSDDKADRRLIGEMFDSRSSGELVGGSRFKPLRYPYRLSPGNYVITAWGFGGENPNGNHNLGIDSIWSTNDGNGCLQFVGTSRYGRQGESGFPYIADSGQANQYAAGTFEFFQVPENYAE